MGTAVTQAQTITPDNKVLVAYYSRSGNTAAIAGYIHQAAGGDIFEITPVTPYPNDYRQTTEQAKKEIAAGIRPALKNKISNLKDYDVIFIGSPCWWGTIASPVATFLAENDFSGKKIIPFMTHGGSGFGHSLADIRTLAPQAEIIEGETFYGSRASNSQNDVNKWIKGLQND
ncbi:MAG: flavodoxin [Proteobacteria bacterium]|nr:flavodoxin [Alphaproteobacteria bacterium]MBS4771160.1 flavodoxin [Pseudomonadota bacterium]